MSCGIHENGYAMAKKILQDGYYWLMMETEYYHYAKTCPKCHIYVDKVHVPHTPLNVLIAPRPFSMWAIDVFGIIEPKPGNGHLFILLPLTTSRNG